MACMQIGRTPKGLDATIMMRERGMEHSMVQVTPVIPEGYVGSIGSISKLFTDWSLIALGYYLDADHD